LASSSPIINGVVVGGFVRDQQILPGHAGGGDLGVHLARRLQHLLVLVASQPFQKSNYGVPFQRFSHFRPLSKVASVLGAACTGISRTTPRFAAILSPFRLRENGNQWATIRPPNDRSRLDTARAPVGKIGQANE
jgi:hypothetical protein